MSSGRFSVKTPVSVLSTNSPRLSEQVRRRAIRHPSLTRSLRMVCNQRTVQGLLALGCSRACSARYLPVVCRTRCRAKAPSEGLWFFWGPHWRHVDGRAA